MKTYKHILFLLFFGLLTLQQVHADNVGKFTLQKVANLSDDAAALTGNSKLGTIEEVYVTENHLSKLKTVEIYKNADGVLAWRALANEGCDWFSLSSFKNISAKIPGGANHPNIAKNIDNIEALKDLNRISLNPKLVELGITEDMLAKVKCFGNNGITASFRETLQSIDNLASNIANHGIDVQNFDKLIHTLSLGNNAVDGASWTMKYINGNIAEFANTTIKFEEKIVGSSGIRYIDLTSSTSTNKILFEFKSVLNVPPNNFNSQFIKDLTNATSLENIRWIFNKSKFNGTLDEFKTAMKSAVDGLPLTDDLAEKFLGTGQTAQDLKNHLKTIINNNNNHLINLYQ